MAPSAPVFERETVRVDGVVAEVEVVGADDELGAEDAEALRDDDPVWQQE